MDLGGRSHKDEREALYRRAYLTGVRDERERAVKAGVMRDGKYIDPTTNQGAVELLDEFDRYACIDDGTAYAGSPFEARVRAFLSSHRGGSSRV